MMTDSIGTGGKWGTGTQIMPGHKPTLVNGKIFKFREKRQGQKERFAQRKKDINRKMNTDEILTYSLGPKARAQNNQEHFKEL
jgi:hypothetical protein